MGGGVVVVAVVVMMEMKVVLFVVRVMHWGLLLSS